MKKTEYAHSLFRSFIPERSVSKLGLGRVAAVATIIAADLAMPNSNEGARVAVRAAPCKNVAVGRLDNGEYVAGALICHDNFVLV